MLRTDIKRYPEEPPFHPPVSFPELRRAGIVKVEASNAVYGVVRDMLALFGLDHQHFGSPEWNPFGAYIRRGDKVVLKPNFVLHEFGAQEGANCLTTHGSVLRAVLDYAHLAAGPEGRIAIADAPLQGADFESVVAKPGIRRIQEFYQEQLRYDLEVVDLRQVHAVIDGTSSLIRRVEQLLGDPRGYCQIDLGATSRLKEVDSPGTRYAVGDYDMAVTNARHRSPHHTYVVSRTILDADAVIGVPKLKTHSKCGVTASLKNVIGIIGSKDCLPHHRHGKTDQGGDEFPSDYPLGWLLSARAHASLQGRVSPGVWRLLRSLAATVLGAGTPTNGNGNHCGFFPSGGWHGNDTLWRTVDDLNRILFFYDPVKGAMQRQPRRRYFSVVDGIIAMEGNGPLRGSPRSAGVVMGGDDPLALDVVAATLMGFDWRRIRMLTGIANSSLSPLYSAFNGDESALKLLTNYPAWSSFEDLKRTHLNILAPAGWREFVEMQHVG